VITFKVNVTTSFRIDELVGLASAPAGLTAQFFYNGVAQAGSFVPPTGAGVLQLAITTTGTAGNAGLRFGCGLNGPLTADVTFWDAQWELGAFATSYIPTVAASVTRNPDTVSMTGTNFSDWFNASAGAFVVNFSVLAIDTSKRRYTWFVSESGTTRLNLRAMDSNVSFPIAAIGTGASVVSLNGSAITTNTTIKIAVAYGANMALSQNGAAPATNASASSVVGPSLFIGCSSSGTGNELCGHVQELNFYPQRLLNAETQAFSK
jgi:hypothetical protein